MLILWHNKHQTALQKVYSLKGSGALLILLTWAAQHSCILSKYCFNNSHFGCFENFDVCHEVISTDIAEAALIDYFKAVDVVATGHLSVYTI